MKRVYYIVFLVMIVPSLFAELVFEEMIDVNPIINVFTDNEENDVISAMKIYFLKYKESILMWDVQKNEVVLLGKEKLPIDLQTIDYFFLNPISKKTFSITKGSENQSVYEIVFNQDESIKTNKLEKWKISNLINENELVISDNICFNSTYEYIGGKKSIVHLITSSNNVLWSYSTKNEHLDSGVLFVNDEWLLKKYWSSNNYKTSNVFSLENWKTGENTSFLPETIIGYGKDVIITTNIKDNEIYGISLWTPEGICLFQDKSYNLSKIIKRNSLEIFEPIINDCYFNYPFIIISNDVSGVSAHRAENPPIIINVLTNKVLLGKFGYRLFGVTSENIE